VRIKIRLLVLRGTPTAEIIYLRSVKHFARPPCFIVACLSGHIT